MLLLCAGPNLSLLQLDDCLYLLRRNALQTRLEQLNSGVGNPGYICVRQDSPCLAMASEHDVRVRHST